MGIFDRLGSVINSYFNDFTGNTEGMFKSSSKSGDPDVNAAFDELNDYLNNKGSRSEKQSWQDTEKKYYAKPAGSGLPPEELRADYNILGVPFGADEEACKTAYKQLLKKHHPDRHAGHEGNIKKATEMSAKINAAYDRIEKYNQTKKLRS